MNGAAGKQAGETEHRTGMPADKKENRTGVRPAVKQKTGPEQVRE